MRWVVGEAGRNLVSGTTHALRYALVLALVLGTLVVAEVAGVDTILARAEAYRDSGGSVLTLEAAGRVDGTRCQALGDIPGVRAAGALRAEPDTLVAVVLPRGPMATYAVTDGFLKVVHAERVSTAGVVVSQNVADSLGLSHGSDLATTSGTTTVQGTFAWPDDGRRSGFAYAALVPTQADEIYDQCWVDAWPVPGNLPALIRTTVLPASDSSGQISVSRLNTTLGASFDGHDLYQSRVTRYAVVAGVLASMLVGLVSIRTRRLELASARHVGTSSLAQHLQILIETAVWVLAAGMLAAAATGTTIALAHGHDSGALVAAAIHVGVPSLLAALLGAQLAVALTRERHLFQYFKNR
ncbi:MAG: hypothetical protein FWH11_05065 [Micrococcales bacterium]|nr:hypothetical protein [Micrococcales bacterium]